MGRAGRGRVVPSASDCGPEMCLSKGAGGHGGGGGVLEGKRPQRRPQRRLHRRLEEVAAAVGGGYCPLHMPLKLAFVSVRETVARLGA